jgi:hypothetical protein
MRRHVALVRTDVSEKHFTTIIMVERQLLVTANVVPSSLIPFTLMMEALRSSRTSVLIRITRCHIQEGGILHNYRRENFKSYKC